MRLINVHDLELREFQAQPPPYAILSHRWTDDEITYRDFIDGQRKSCKGYEKVIRFCDFVKEHRDYETLFEDYFKSPDARDDLRAQPRVKQIDWVWLDTCCIHKESSAELSEAINSMWKYYGNAAYCVVYLADLPPGLSQRADKLEYVKKSEWFTRGWCLQELLAPRLEIFCDAEWEIFGRKSERDISKAINMVTRIPMSVLSSPRQSMGEMNFAQKISWVATRRTTREEDLAYCLLGLLEINMPLMYGEGGEKAFLRLQKQFLEQFDDESIFAWDFDRHDQHAGRWAHIDNRIWGHGVLAQAPSWFEHSARTVYSTDISWAGRRMPYAVTNKGLQFDGPALRVQRFWFHEQEDGLREGVEPDGYLYLVPLRCGEAYSDDKVSNLDIPGSFPSSPVVSQRCILLFVSHTGIAFRVNATAIRLDLKMIQISTLEQNKQFLIRISGSHKFMGILRKQMWHHSMPSMPWWKRAKQCFSRRPVKSPSVSKDRDPLRDFPLCISDNVDAKSYSSSTLGDYGFKSSPEESAFRNLYGGIRPREVTYEASIDKSRY